MGQTITEKIFSEHVGKKVFAGEIVRSKIDMVIGNDITTPISIKAFEDGGFEKLANPDGFAIVLDHFIPAKDIASANQAKISRDFAYKHNLKNFFDEKDMGIEHALAISFAGMKWSKTIANPSGFASFSKPPSSKAFIEIGVVISFPITISILLLTISPAKTFFPTCSLNIFSVIV
jgi:hypothetical protein